MASEFDGEKYDVHVLFRSRCTKFVHVDIHCTCTSIQVNMYNVHVHVHVHWVTLVTTTGASCIHDLLLLPLVALCL